MLSAKSELELAAAREEDLRRRLSSGRGDAVAANEKLVRYEELKRAVDTNRQFYETLMSRAKEESLTQQLQGVQVYTLEPAVVPEAPDGPRTARTILLGLVAGAGRRRRHGVVRRVPRQHRALGRGPRAQDRACRFSA